MSPITFKELDGLVPLFLQLPAENIVILKFLFESYEGLGIIRTMDQEKAVIVILALQDTIATVREVLASVQNEVRFREIEPPEDVCEDWLLSETLST